MINAPVNPPVTSRILFEAVAIREPPITVKVISAIFVEKYFIPKKDEVKADVTTSHTIKKSTSKDTA